ncbi:TPA: hypothetical protein ACOJRH_005164 [Vibrio harveyi]|uniref:hypothetical protein n=1 Tax=Vibrio TaxID=662 RepID=UPI00066CA31F|nr:hypothetical protein [Vibrio harveyi]EHV2843292.1 hypothetical protein [Vibrio vulnificus]ELR8729952.1 hypothetical protein [Vibrio vulnificus]
MKFKVSKDDCIAEAKRFFKYYDRFCQSPDSDDLRELLASAYSANDKFRKAGMGNFFESKEFLSIKAIRNFFIHQAELLNETKSLPVISDVPISGDTNIVCLVPSERFELIKEASNEAANDSFNETMVFYRDFVDIYPCIFNFGVKFYFFIKALDFNLNTEEVLKLENSLEFERKNGYSHYIGGRISLPLGGCIDEFLAKNLISMDERKLMMETLYEEKNGMYVFKMGI